MFASTPRLHSKPGSDGARLLSVQALRAVAALLVVWVHTIPAHFPVPQSRFLYWQDFGSCGVDIFFVISGFVISLAAGRAGEPIENGSAARRFLGQRITRIFPLYWILTCIIYGGGFARHQLAGIHRIWWLPTLLLFPSLSYPANPPLLYLGWTLLFEMYFYLILAMFLAWTPRSVVRNAIFFLCGMVASGLIVGSRRPLLVVWMNPMTLEFLFGCLIGVLFVRTRNTGESYVRTGKTMALLGGGLLVATMVSGPHAAVQLDSVFAGKDCWWRVGLWGMPAALLVGGVVFWTPVMRTKPARLFVFLGNASYSIYLCTIPALWLARPGWNSLGKPAPRVGALIDGIWATSVGIVCYLVLERPLTGIFHDWQKRPLRGAAARLREDGERSPERMVRSLVTGDK